MTRFRKLSVASALMVATVSAMPAQAALVAHWNLDANASDTTGNHDGAVVNAGVTFGQAGARITTGRSASFTGTGHIDVPHSAATNPASFTATLWALPTAAGGGAFRSPLTSRDDIGGGVTTHGYILYNNSTGNWSFWTGDGDPGWDELTGPAVVTNQWTHLAISFDAGTNTKSLYVNGNLAQTTTGQQYSVNGPQSEALHIGAGADNGASFNWAGNIDDVAVFNTALSLAEIQQVRSHGVSNFVNEITPLVITPVSITQTAGTSDPVHGAPINLINGSGLSAVPTIDNILSVTHAAGNSTNQWVTTAIVPDYYASGADPVFVFDLGDEYDLTDIVMWNYGVPGNAAKEFDVEFFLYGDEIDSVTGLIVPQASGPAHAIDLGGTFRADMVRITFTDNYFGQGGGGDRVGLNEVRFVGSLAIIPEPASAGLALIGALALIGRRRRVA